MCIVMRANAYVALYVAPPLPHLSCMLPYMLPSAHALGLALCRPCSCVLPRLAYCHACCHAHALWPCMLQCRSPYVHGLCHVRCHDCCHDHASGFNMCCHACCHAKLSCNGCHKAIVMYVVMHVVMPVFRSMDVSRALRAYVIVAIRVVVVVVAVIVLVILGERRLAPQPTTTIIISTAMTY